MRISFLDDNKLHITSDRSTSKHTRNTNNNTWHGRKVDIVEWVATSIYNCVQLQCQLLLAHGTSIGIAKLQLS
jgi:hypothetical protein